MASFDTWATEALPLKADGFHQLPPFLSVLNPVRLLLIAISALSLGAKPAAAHTFVFGQLYLPPTRVGLRWADWLIILIYMITLQAIGRYYTRKQTDQEDQFIAARKPMSPALIGISHFGSRESWQHDGHHTFGRV